MYSRYWYAGVLTVQQGVHSKPPSSLLADCLRSLAAFTCQAGCAIADGLQECQLHSCAQKAVILFDCRQLMILGCMLRQSQFKLDVQLLLVCRSLNCIAVRAQKAVILFDCRQLMSLGCLLRLSYIKLGAQVLLVCRSPNCIAVHAQRAIILFGCRQLMFFGCFHMSSLMHNCWWFAGVLTA